VQRKQEELREARQARAEGKIYTQQKGWFFYILDEEALELMQETTSSMEETKEKERVVANREYYDLLKVSTNATSVELKKAYYREARLCHPDKNPDDEEAHQKFQKLGQAYQTLSDPQRRAAYDKEGTEPEEMPELDAFVFFNVMFGSALVEPYIGELWIASTADSVMNENLEDLEDESLSEEERTEKMRQQYMESLAKQEIKQRKRQVQCAQFLRQRVQPYFEDADAFRQSCRDEATKIAAGPYGALYCMTIGFALEVAADEYLGFETTFLGLGGHVARTRKNASGFASGMKLLGAGIRAASAGVRTMKEAEELQAKAEEGREIGEQDAQQLEQAMNGTLPAFLELAWAVNKRDIQSTLKAVCKKLFDDAGVPKEFRLERAQAVKILGREFQVVGKQAMVMSRSMNHFDAEDIKARLAVATMTTMAKAQGQEVTEEDQELMVKQAKMEMAGGMSPDVVGEGREGTSEGDGMGASEDL
jgi:curved DNA-binding protein CbpA